MRATEYVEEVEFLRSLGISHAQIADQLRVKPGSVAKALRRAGRRDLAAPFERASNSTRARTSRDRKKLCPACGVQCNYKSRSCMHCYRASRTRKAAA